MSHPLYDVIDFEIVGDYTLRVVFDDESEQIINFEPVLFGELYAPLKDLKLFKKVQLDREVHNLVWPNGADFDPWMLHEWPKLVEQLTAKAKEMSNETDWDRLDKMTDEDIDYSDIPPLDDEFFARARVYVPPSKRKNFVQLDEEVLSWFKTQSKEYQTLINDILKKYMEMQAVQPPQVSESASIYQVERKSAESIPPQAPKITPDKREKDAFLRLYPKLKKKYLGKFVAVYQEKLVDSDQDFGALFERIDTKYSDQFVWIAKVEEQPEPPIMARSPRFEELG